MTHPVLKQFGDLTAADFKQHPVWVSVHTLDYDEEWYAETDEETFRPWTGKRPVGAEHMFLVSARFRFADGSEFEGFVTPVSVLEGLRSMGDLQPQVFSPAGELFSFWFGMFGSPETVAAFYKRFAKTPAQVFPVFFQTLPELTTAVASGEIPGFLSMPQGEEVKIIR